MKSHFKTRFEWLDGENIRPYVYVRPENQIANPGSLFHSDWFPKQLLYRNPLQMSEVDFANQILRMEAHAFSSTQMAMPRWVFFDCAIVPGFVAGFAMKTKLLPPSLRELLKPNEDSEWSPLSLFIIIPTMGEGEWVAHNLCSANSFVSKEERLYGLGFLSKAFGLWHANIEICCGITQWAGQALPLHSHYGALEVLTAYTPVHTFAETMLYRLRVDPAYWPRFFDAEPSQEFHHSHQPAGFKVDPYDTASLTEFQFRIEKKQGPFFLDGGEIRKNGKGPLTVYRPK